MSVYSELIEWSRKRYNWQRDVLRFLAQGGSPTDADVIRWKDMCITESAGGQSGAMPLDDMHVPADGGTGPAITISAIANVQNVNAIADGQRLEFSRSGLTVIYGGNGTGKSGYSRILKQTCHARGSADEVLSNVYGDEPKKPTADLEFFVGGQKKVLAWEQGIERASGLARVAFFDSRSATAILEGTNEIVFMPGGLDLLPKLSGVVDAVSDKLRDDESTYSVPWRPPQCAPNSPGSTFLAKLAHSTAPGEINALKLSQDEESELQQLATALKTPDPLVSARAIDQQVTRIESIKSVVQSIERTINQATIDSLTTAWNNWQNAVAAEKQLATDTFSEAKVDGVGGSAWRTLWQAAEAFASTGATPDNAFPSSAQPSYCVLCQQPVSETAGERLGRFHAFVRSTVAGERNAAALALKGIVDGVGRLTVPGPSQIPVLDELRDLDEQNAEKLPTWLKSAGAAKAEILGLRTNPSVLPQVSPIATGWTVWLKGLADGQRQKAAALRKAAKPEEKQRLQARVASLTSRQVLYAVRAEIAIEIGRLKRLSRIGAAKKLLGKRGLTTFADSLTQKFVSSALMNAFDTEAGQLSLGVTVKYSKARPRAGRSYHKVQLEMSQWAGRSGPTQILSEGERRAVSLAAFFAELSARVDTSAIVLDDPVSSLDHERRSAVARRLVEEAIKRQVVVFTHDLVFLKFLEEIATKEQKVPCRIFEVCRLPDDTVGHCTGEPPWTAMKFGAQSRVLKNKVAGLRTKAKTDPNEVKDQIPRVYGLLRMNAERALEEGLLGGCVERFSRGVHATALWKVRALEDDDVRKFLKIYDRATTYSQCHDATPAESPKPATLDDLETDILELAVLVKAVRKRH